MREAKAGTPYTLATFANIPYFGTMSSNALGGGVAVDVFQNVWSSGRAATLTSVMITPHLGSLTTLEAAMPVPQGMVRVSYRRSGAGVAVEVEVPEGGSGTFVWGGNRRALKAGRQRFEVSPGR